MSSTATPAKILGLLCVTFLAAASLRISRPRTGSELSILMEPDGTGVWREIVDRFNSTRPRMTVRLAEGPPSTDAREDMYSTAFLAGQSGYDIVFCDVISVPKFAAAGWLLDLTTRLSPADRDDFLPSDLKAGSYEGRLYRIPAFTDAGLLYYRKDLVQEPPTTFQDLIDAASKFKT